MRSMGQECRSISRSYLPAFTLSLPPPLLAASFCSHSGCLLCWDKYLNIAMAFCISVCSTSGVSCSCRVLMPLGGLFSTNLHYFPLLWHNGDNVIKKNDNKRKESGSCLTFCRQQGESGLTVVRRTEAELPTCPHRLPTPGCPLELSASITALNGGSRLPAQGCFIPLDGKQKKWENEALCVLKSPGCDVLMYNITGNQLLVKWVGTLALGTTLPSSWALPGVGVMEILSPGHCCCMTDYAGIRACNGSVSIQTFSSLSVGDGCSFSIVPCWIAQRDTC